MSNLNRMGYQIRHVLKHYSDEELYDLFGDIFPVIEERLKKVFLPDEKIEPFVAPQKDNSPYVFYYPADCR